ncbi:MAG TPA: aminotransferase class V-fold PLP-dependent enzyme [Patescibacteria group bacterium]|nr:aminotransferase class V-fold PLP-dependent enzyme [Patescibacteria group bacterium]
MAQQRISGGGLSVQGDATDGLIRSAADRATRYLRDLPGRRVSPGEADVAQLAELGGVLPDEPVSDVETLELLDRVGSPATVASAGPRYFGFVTGGTLPVTVAANVLAAAWDQNAFGPVASPVGAELERVALEWLVDVLRLPSGSYGALVTGTQMANFCGIAAARHAVLARAGWDVEEKGLAGAPPVRVVAGAEAHATLVRAVSLAGLGRGNIELVAVDAQGRMRPDALPRLDERTILCIQAGNVNSGAFDPAGELCAAAREAGAWVHVDGAFGLWARAAPGREHLAAGVEQADSWAVDAHKWLNTPYDTGVVLVRRPEDLAAAMSLAAAYIPPSGRAAIDYSPEASRRARGIGVWAALRSLGRSGVADLVERCCALATRFEARLREGGCEVLNDVVLNQVVVAFGDDDTTRKVIQAVQDDGTCWCGGTVWHGRAAMRISVSSWATTAEDVDRSADAILRVAGRTTKVS